MPAPEKDERIAIDAVAKRFSAVWRRGDDPSDACLSMGGRRIGVEIAVLAPSGPARKGAAIPRLRYDRVALRFLRDIRAGLRPVLLDGETALVAIRAPILQSGKTAAALVERVRSRRVSQSRTTEIGVGAFGNRITVRVVRDARGGASEVIGFVHSAGASPAPILNAAQSLLDRLRAKGTADAKEGQRWIVLLGETALAKSLRDACLQISRPTGFDKVLLVDARGRVETLAG